MAGLFELCVFCDDRILAKRKIFATSLRGALTRASRICETLDEMREATVVVVHDLSIPTIRRRRFCDSGVYLSPWVDFSEEIYDNPF